MRAFLMLVFCLLSAAVVAQVGKAQQGNSLAGVWVNNQYGYQMTLLLNADGSGEFDGEAITYSITGNKLMMKQAGATNTYSFTRQGTSLTLSGGDIDGSVTFTRMGNESSPTTTTPDNSSSLKPSTPPAKLIGVWSGNGESIEFKADGQCLYLGQMYPYQVSGATVTLQTMQGNLAMAYEIQGSQLHLRANGQTVTYTKGGQATDNTTSTGKRQIAQELVGKWCWINVTSTNSGGSTSEQCITLNADGSYQYYGERSSSVNTNAYSGGTSSQNSDYGTWTYDGSRIYYTSQAGNGAGSYVLEKRNHPKTGDPMIVLDGSAYVTYYQKSPWR